MRKIVSLTTVAVMLVSIFSFMITGASANTLSSSYKDAKDGELLYELKFGETTGVYVPEMFRAGIEGDLVPEKALDISADGRTIAFHKPGLTSGGFFYGGKIEGLTWGDDKAYTITMKLSLPNKRGGVYFNFPSETKQNELKGTGPSDNSFSSVMYGIYGRFNQSADLGAMLGPSRKEGRFMFQDKNGSYRQFDYITVKD